MPSVRVKLGSVAYLDAANLGYGIGLDPDGHRIEFIGSYAVLAPFQARLDAGERVEVDVEDCQVVTEWSRTPGDCPGAAGITGDSGTAIHAHEGTRGILREQRGSLGPDS